MTDMNHMDHLLDVKHFDLEQISQKESTYKGSWKKRGGVGAFMMLARKWDRLEEILTQYQYDIFKGCEANLEGIDGSALAELRDLRCYATLIEAEILARVTHAKESRKPQPARSVSPAPRPVAAARVSPRLEGESTVGSGSGDKR